MFALGTDDLQTTDPLVAQTWHRFPQILHKMSVSRQCQAQNFSNSGEEDGFELYGKKASNQFDSSNSRSLLGYRPTDKSNRGYQQRAEQSRRNCD